MVPLRQYVQRYHRPEILSRAGILPGVATAAALAAFVASCAWIPPVRDFVQLAPTWAWVCIAGWMASSLSANLLYRRTGWQTEGLACHLVGSATLQWFFMTVIVDAAPWPVRFAFGIVLVFSMGSHGDAMRVTVDAPYHALASTLFAAISVARCPEVDCQAFLIILEVAGLFIMLVLGHQRVAADRFEAQLAREREAVAAALLSQTHSAAARLEHEVTTLMGAHHDARNILTSALLKSDLLLRKLQQRVEEVPAADVEQTLFGVRDALKLAASVFDQSTRPTATDIPVDFGPVFDRQLDDFHRAEPHIRLDAPAAVPARLVLPGGPVTVRRILENLLLNASEGDGRRGALHIRVETRLEGPHLHVRISDDGPGFPKEVLGAPRRRFTMKAEGSGLGLITVDSLVRACGGILQLSNRPEGGAQVDLFLPVAQQRPPLTDAQGAA
jgi:two-component system C4-dicarboxylate transport sensor histidine kinase DctB